MFVLGNRNIGCHRIKIYIRHGGRNVYGTPTRKYRDNNLCTRYKIGEYEIRNVVNAALDLRVLIKLYMSRKLRDLYYKTNFYTCCNRRTLTFSDTKMSFMNKFVWYFILFKH